jgi:hypothetical protein
VEAGRKGIRPDCRAFVVVGFDGLRDIGFCGYHAGHTNQFPDGGGAKGVFGGAEWDSLVDAEF